MKKNDGNGEEERKEGRKAYEMKWECEMKKELTDRENSDHSSKNNNNQNENDYTHLMVRCLILGPLPAGLLPLCPATLSQLCSNMGWNLL